MAHPNGAPPAGPVSQFRIELNVDMITGELRIIGPDILDARPVYDYVIREIERMQAVRMVQAAGNATGKSGLLVVR